MPREVGISVGDLFAPDGCSGRWPQPWPARRVLRVSGSSVSWEDAIGVGVCAARHFLQRARKYGLVRYPEGGHAPARDLRATADTATLALLQAHLEAFVPLRIAELQRLPWAEVSGRLARESAQVIAEKGDVILYRSKKKGETAKAVSALVTGFAVLAFVPGGVRALGCHFEATHPETAEHSETAEPPEAR